MKIFRTIFCVAFVLTYERNGVGQGPGIMEFDAVMQRTLEHRHSNFGGKRNCDAGILTSAFHLQASSHQLQLVV